MRTAMVPLIALNLLLVASLLSAQSAPNLLHNGDFETVTNGKPDEWAVAGDSTVVQRLESDIGREGGHSAKLVCTSITGNGPASHVMLAQVNVVALKAGKWYRLTFWAKQQGLDADAIQVSVSQTKPWKGGMRNTPSFQPTEEWRAYDLQFRADNDVPADASRFQIWLHSAGTLWFDDMVLEEIPRPQFTPLTVIEPAPGKNLVPNASFECGTGGWASIGRASHWTWGGNLTGLLGELDATAAAHGKSSLKVRLSPNTAPVFYFDYFEMYREPIQIVTTANLGWLRLEKGATYTLSAMMKSDRPDLKIKMKVERMGQQDVQLTTDWQRYTMTRKATDEHGYVGFELDLPAQKLEEATLWLDAVQLEKSDQATDFAPRAPVEVALSTDKPSHVFSTGEPVELKAAICNQTEADAKATVSLSVSDFFDEPVGEAPLDLSAPPKGTASVAFPLPMIKKKGFYRVAATVTAGGATRTHVVRIVVIDPYREKDSFLGVNHAFPWDSLMKLKQLGGAMWTRDWSLKWSDVEPEKGRFDFSETDYQINRPIQLGDQVLGLLPFPSSTWSSTAPTNEKVKSEDLGERARIAFMPRDMREFETYVVKTVTHYKDRIKYWEIMNEPLYTSYALPMSSGHQPKDYVAILKCAYEAIKRTDPTAKVIGGIAYPDGPLFEQIFDLGALDYMDYLNTHTYPKARPPEKTQQELDHLNQLMDAKGKRKQIWCTEYAYYADDDMPGRPMIFEMPFVKTEKLCAAYMVRINAIMLGNGATKLFYHAGTCGTANGLNFEGFLFKYAGPRKLYAALSAMANLFGPDTKPMGKIEAPEGGWGFLYENPRRALAVAWRTGKENRTLLVKDDRLQVLDIQGNPMDRREIALNEFPVYVVGTGLKAEDIRKAVECK